MSQITQTDVTTSSEQENKSAPQPPNPTIPLDPVQPRENKSTPPLPNSNNLLLQLILWLAIMQILILESLAIWAYVTQHNASILIPIITLLIGLLRAWIELLKVWVSNRSK